MTTPTSAEVQSALAVIASATVAPVVAEAKTVGQDLDARLATLEAAAKSDYAAAKAWLAANWAHFVTWAGIAYSSGALSAIFKHV